VTIAANSTVPEYSIAVARLLEPERIAELDRGTPNLVVREQLMALTPENVVAPRAAKDRNMAAACVAALWLYHDYLDESHTISQSITTPTGSYWHGIMHRREGDFSNAKYWMRRVGSHAVFEPLCAAARQLAAEHARDKTVEFLSRQSQWDPLQWIDLCAAAVAGPTGVGELCRAIQSREWRLLFDYSYAKAVD